MIFKWYFATSTKPQVFFKAAAYNTINIIKERKKERNVKVFSCLHFSPLFTPVQPSYTQAAFGESSSLIIVKQLGTVQSCAYSM